MGQAQLAREHFAKAVQCPVDPKREDPEYRQRAQQAVQAQ